MSQVKDCDNVTGVWPSKDSYNCIIYFYSYLWPLTHSLWLTNNHILSKTAWKYSLIGFHGKPSHDFWGNFQNVCLFQKKIINSKKTSTHTDFFFFHQKANVLKSEVSRFLNVIQMFPRSEFWTPWATVHISDGLHSLSVSAHGSSFAIWEMSCLPWVVKPV